VHFLYLSLLLTLSAADVGRAQSIAAEPAKPSNPAPDLSREQIETFLKTAKVVSQKVLTAGTTKSTRATLNDGQITHDAHVQCVDIYKPTWRGAEGTVEKNFRDSYKFNIAAYRIGVLLGIGEMIPPSVERVLDGKPCSITWWVDNIWITEAERRDKGIKPPPSDAWVNQLNSIRVFDQLIYNTDRNQGNLLITPEWKVWMIDHTRAFRTNHNLLKPETLRRIDHRLLDSLRALTTESIRQASGPWLRPEEVAALLSRRDAIIAYFDKQIVDQGRDAVLTGLPRETPRVSVP
jgi:hypothetical protein